MFLSPTQCLTTSLGKGLFVSVSTEAYPENRNASDDSEPGDFKSETDSAIETESPFKKAKAVTNIKTKHVEENRGDTYGSSVGFEVGFSGDVVGLGEEESGIYA